MPLITIDTMGTNIGDLTGGGGLAAAFDGVTSQAASACALQPSGAQTWIGKTLPFALRFASATVYGSNDQGFGGNDGPMGLRIYGKNGSVITNPVTDGSTLIGSLNFDDTSDESSGRIITSTDTASFWEHLAVQVAGAGFPVSVAEVRLVCATRPTHQAVIFG